MNSINFLLTFITILAWFAGVFTTLIIALKLFMTMTYTDLQKLLDKCQRGYVVNYMHNFLIWLTIALVSWAWIIARAVAG